jgi:hypothetical protein
MGKIKQYFYETLSSGFENLGNKKPPEGGLTTVPVSGLNSLRAVLSLYPKSKLLIFSPLPRFYP